MQAAAPAANPPVTLKRRSRSRNDPSQIIAAQTLRACSAADRALSVPKDPNCIPCITSSPLIEELEAKMTAKQILLARILANESHPVSKVVAFRAVYDYELEDKAKTVYEMATALCNHPKVKALAQALKDETRARNSALLASQDALRHEIAADLLSLAKTATDPKIRLAALRTLGQTVHARSFARAEADEATQAAGDLATELLSKLKSLAKGTTDSSKLECVDVTPLELEAGEAIES